MGYFRSLQLRVVGLGVGGSRVNRGLTLLLRASSFVISAVVACQIMQKRQLPSRRAVVVTALSTLDYRHQ